MSHALIDLETLEIEGVPGPLPATLRGLTQDSLDDLAWAEGYDAAWAGKGFWPVVEIRPALESWQRHAAEPTLAVDAEGKRVTATCEPEDLPLAEVKAARLALLSAYRYGIETGGITLGGASIRTDRESQALVTGAHALVTAAPETVIDWKGAAGWTQLDAATMTAIALAVGAHVQACFSAERAHAEAIEACETPEDAGSYDFTGGWPE